MTHPNLGRASTPGAAIGVGAPINLYDGCRVVGLPKPDRVVCRTRWRYGDSQT